MNSAVRIWVRWVMALMLVLHVSAPVAGAVSVQPVIGIDTDRGTITLNPAQQSSYFLEDGRAFSIDEIRKAHMAEKFMPVTETEPRFGYREDGIWLRLAVQNTTDRNLRQILHMKTNFMTEMDVYLENERGLTTLLSQNSSSVFASRAIPWHNLATRFDLPAGQISTIWIRFRSQGATVLPLSLMTPDAFTREVSNTLSVDFAFYGVMIMFLVSAAAAATISRGPLFVAYFFYVLSVLLYIFQRDGYAFQYLWPNAPQWNNFSSLPIGAGLPMFAAVFAIIYLQPRGMGLLTRRGLFAIILLQPMIVASSIFFEVWRVKQFAVLSTTLCILAFLVIGINAWRREGAQLIWFVIGWFGIVMASLTMSASHNFGIELTRAQTLDTMRSAMVFDALMMGIASVANLIKLQRERLVLIDEREADIRKTMELQSRLGKLEQRHAISLALAQSNSRLVADTAHDLRQPLFALRAAMSDMLQSSRQDQDKLKLVEASLRHIEDLTEAALEAATADPDPDPEHAVGHPPAEPMAASRILTAIAGMFEADSKAANVRMRVVDSPHEVMVNPLLVLRILGNFVANALQHAPRAQVLVGARRRGNMLLFEVRDTGPGMAPAELERVQQRHARGDTAAANGGRGLGLSIVADLAERAGLEWSIRSTKGRGSCATLAVPMCQPTSGKRPRA